VIGVAWSVACLLGALLPCYPTTLALHKSKAVATVSAFYSAPSTWFRLDLKDGLGLVVCFKSKGGLPNDFVFQSAKYVPREIQIQTGRSRKDIELGLIGSIQPTLRSHAEISMADGSTTQLDLMTSQFRRMNADQPKVVKWEMTRSNTWLLEDSEWPKIINDSSCDFNFSAESQTARLEWMKLFGKSFPTVDEAISVLESARSTIDDAECTCRFTEPVLEWYMSKEPALLPTAIENLIKLLATYQKGSLLHDSAQVLLTMCRENA